MKNFTVAVALIALTMVGAHSVLAQTATNVVADGGHHFHASQDQTITAYTKIRAALAGDNKDAATGAATALQKAAKKQGHTAVAAAAGDLAKASTIDAARTAFGATSKALLTLLAKTPAMAKGLTAYKCGMAKGYQKWVQAAPKLGNPYFGKQMLGCGSKSTMTP